MSNVLLKSPKNPNFNPEAINNINKIKLNFSSNNKKILSPKKGNFHDVSISSERLKENPDYIQNLNIEFFDTLSVSKLRFFVYLFFLCVCVFCNYSIRNLLRLKQNWFSPFL